MYISLLPKPSEPNWYIKKKLKKKEALLDKSAQETKIARQSFFCSCSDLISQQQQQQPRIKTKNRNFLKQKSLSFVLNV